MGSRDASWGEVADRLRAARSYWLGTSHPDGSPHAVPVWGVILDQDLYLYSERSTAKARHVTADPRVVVHLEDAEDVVIVNGRLDDLGSPSQHAKVLAALATKYHAPADAPYLPTSDPAFDVLWRLRPDRAMLWRLDEYEESQGRWVRPT